MKRLMFRSRLTTLILVSSIASLARGGLSGTVPAAPGATVAPGLTSDAAGTLLATLSAPFTTATGTSSGTMISAVFRDAGGTLDFYYQLTNNTTSTGCGGANQPGCDSLVRLAGMSFLGFATALGYRTDGSALPGGAFVDGSVVPASGDRDSAGPAVAFSFFPPDSAKVHPGTTSSVLVVSTDATSFAAGFVTVSDGGFATVSSFQPSGHNLVVSGASPAAVEAASFSGTVGAFQDTDTAAAAGNFTATIDWGDGTGTSAGTVSGSNGSFSVSGTHPFADEGSFSGTLTVHDAADDLTKIAPVTFTVAEGDALAGTGVDFSRAPGIPFSGTVANFTDTNHANVAGDFTATIVWGDGNTTAGVVTGGSGAFAVSGSHTYAFPGVFTVTTTLADDAPGTASAIAQSTASIGSTIPTLGGPGLAMLIAAIGLAGLWLLKRPG